jgi:hypothetical protein
MAIRIPLIFPVKAVVYRLDIQSTWAVDPPGATASEGYNYITGEPNIYRNASGARVVPRVEMAPIDIPCQIEDARFEEIQMVFGGNSPITNLVFVFHRRDLENLGLLDASTRDCLLKTGDRIGSVKNTLGSTVKTFQKPLYIYEFRFPGSQGFGPDGYDLEIAYTSYRTADPQGR